MPRHYDLMGVDPGPYMPAGPDQMPRLGGPAPYIPSDAGLFQEPQQAPMMGGGQAPQQAPMMGAPPPQAPMGPMMGAPPQVSPMGLMGAPQQPQGFGGLLQQLAPMMTGAGLGLISGGAPSLTPGGPQRGLAQGLLAGQRLMRETAATAAARAKAIRESQLHEIAMRKAPSGIALQGAQAQKALTAAKKAASEEMYREQIATMSPDELASEQGKLVRYLTPGALPPSKLDAGVSG